MVLFLPTLKKCKKTSIYLCVCVCVHVRTCKAALVPDTFAFVCACAHACVHVRACGCVRACLCVYEKITLGFFSKKEFTVLDLGVAA